MTGSGTSRKSEQSQRSRLIVMLTSLAFMSPFSTACAQQEGEQTLKIVKKADQEVIDGPADWFTGKTTITGMFSKEEPSRVTGAIVTFEPGARTAWHSHPLGQTLIVTDGIGWTQVEGEEKVEFHEGDIVLCPKDKKHWHGATPDSSMTHIAIQEALDGKNVEWMEHVTDDEYLGDAD